MCSYCGCEAEPAIEDLMADHAVISDLAYRITRALDGPEPDRAATLLAQVADLFARHSRAEELGLFAQLEAAGEAVDEVAGLRRDHVRIRAALSDPSLATRPGELRSLLADLAVHAETEDDDLFPFAIQTLSEVRWDALNGPYRAATGA